MKPIPQFDEVHVISDLHLGGRQGFQIFDTAPEVVRLVGDLCQRDPSKRVALVINGDLVDFLAESPSRPFDPLGAVDKLDRIVGDPAFTPVWGALQQFVQTEGRALVITLGNHDIELALPWVRDRLLQILSRDVASARGRIILSFDGSGFLCQVRDARVLCVHGNEVDSWNVADYEVIRRIGRDIVQGRSVDPWVPNGGTQLVVEVMNAVKNRYPFVDLLKPEMEAVIPTLLALDPSQASKIPAILATVGRRTWDRIRMATGFLEGEGGVATQQTPIRSIDGERILRRGRSSPAPRWAGADERGQYAESLLDRTEEAFARNEHPLGLVSRDEQEEYLGLIGAGWKYVRGQKTSEVLREALSDLQKDRSFDPTAPDDTFEALDGLVGPGIDFLLAGHTHLERTLPRKNGTGHYFNTGTWVRLIRLEEAVLADAKAFEEVFNVISVGTMDALDKPEGLVRRRPAVVTIAYDDTRVNATLRHVNRDPSKPLFKEDEK